VKIDSDAIQGLLDLMIGADRTLAIADLVLEMCRSVAPACRCDCICDELWVSMFAFFAGYDGSTPTFSVALEIKV